MSIRPITPTVPPCYGVCCSRHHECARYAAVEHMTGPHAIATCDDQGTGQHPLFVQLQRVTQEEP